MIEPITSYKRTVIAALLVGALFGTSACVGLPGESSSTPAAEVVASPISPSASPAASKPPSIPSALQNVGVEVTGKTLSNSKGSYPEITLNEKSPLMQWNESKHDADTGIPAGWTKKDVEEAQQFASKFMVTKMIDSPANGDHSFTDQWIKENKDLLHPDYRNELIASAMSEDNDTFIFKETWHSKANANNYGYVYDGVSPRIKILDLNIVSSENVSDKAIFFDYDGFYIMNATSDSGPSEQYTHVENIGMSVIKEEGKFYIAGIFTTINTADAS